MEDGKDNDFTFCQVSAPVNSSAFDEQTVVPGIGNISIKEETSSLWNNSLSGNNAAIKEEKVGSLSFNVISAEPQKQSTEAPKQIPVDGSGSSAKKKPAARAKVPFEKGYSQMDWLKLTRTHPDLAGLKGQSNRRLISKSEVKQHQTEGSMWTIFKGRVYNIYPYMKFHPGGDDMLMKAVGKDCTSLFNKYHAWVNAEFLLEKCLVGVLDETSEKK
ncbi:hypothetical protein RND81_08G176900 [Saponaria officinalis]|uniref:Cytochrome b5 heme-binding domain-containing protein n=1 Tax=Saponaria officinalis TaxID=3572 RepID=A0AAW1J815_SAPOF